MGITAFDAANYKIQYVPQKLASIEACVIACYAVLSGQQNEPSTLSMGSVEIDFPDANILIDVAIDAGLVANRVLLNFLGIKLDDGQLKNANSGVTVGKFLLPPVNVADACKILRTQIPSEEMKSIWLEALYTASKATAHFTEMGALIRVARLGYACYATSMLVRKSFYDSIGETAPNSIIPLEMLPNGDGVWISVDPRNAPR